MTPRQVRIGVDVLTVAMVVSVAVALAHLTWRVAGDPGTGLDAAPIATPPSQPVDLGPVIASTPFGTVVTQAAAVGGPLQLRGVMFAHPESASVALISIGGGPAKGYRAGEAVGGSVVDAVAIDHVVLRGNGAQTLALANSGARATGVTSAPTPPPVTTPPASTAPNAPSVPRPSPASGDGIAAIRALIPAEVRGDESDDATTPGRPGAVDSPPAASTSDGRSSPPAAAPERATRRGPGSADERQ